jgi:hypothetical protein
LIEEALGPLTDTLADTDPDVVAQLTRDLVVVVSAEALFTLTNLGGLSPDDAIASAVRTATTLTTAALRNAAPAACQSRTDCQ